MNTITFDTVHLDSTDIEYLSEYSEFSSSNHIMYFKDKIKYDEKREEFHYTYHTTHKLFDKNCGEAIEITIVTIFRPHNIPPTLSDCEEMAKCHFFHTEAILSEKSKNQQVKCFTDIFLFPEDANLELRGKAVFEASENYIKSFIK